MAKNNTNEEPTDAEGADNQDLEGFDMSSDDDSEELQFEPVAEEPPTPDGEPKTEGAAETPEDGEPDHSKTLTFMGEETPVTEILELAEKGRDYTTKTQELSDKETAFAERAELADGMDKLYAGLLGSPDSAREVIGVLEQLARAHHGENWTGTAASISKFTQEEMEQLDDFEMKLMAQSDAAREDARAARAETAAMAQELKAMREAFGQIKPVLDETASSRQLASDIASVKESLGIDVTAEQLAAARKATGKSDAVAAMATHSYRANQAADPNKKAPPATPKTAPREAPRTTNADEIFARAKAEIAEESQ